MKYNPKIRWEAVVIDYNAGVGIKELAYRYNYSTSYVRKILSEMDVHIGRSIATDPLFPQRAMLAVSKATKISIDDLKSKSRCRILVLARYAIMWAMHKRGVPSPAIGRRFDRDHSTVLHGIKKAPIYYQYIPEFARLCDIAETA